MNTLPLIGMLILDFLLTTFCFWFVSLLLPSLGIPLTFAFSWGKAVVVWLICKVIKLIF